MTEFIHLRFDNGTPEKHRLMPESDIIIGRTYTVLQHKVFLKGHEEYLRMVSDMNNQLGVNPTVAALSLFSTNFRSIETAIDFIFEREEDS